MMGSFVRITLNTEFGVVKVAVTLTSILQICSKEFSLLVVKKK